MRGVVGLAAVGLLLGGCGKLTAGGDGGVSGVWPTQEPTTSATDDGSSSSSTGTSDGSGDGSTGPGDPPNCGGGGVVFISGEPSLPELCPDGEWECCALATQCCCEHGRVCEGHCNMWSPECPEGEKCTPYGTGSGWNATACVPEDPNPRQPGDPCTAEGSGNSGIDDCAAGSMCWGTDAVSGNGICVEFCTGTALAPICNDLGTECLVANEDVLALCLPTCDPILQDCAASNVCVHNPTGESFVCVLDASGNGGGDGDACSFLNDCDAGFMCADDSTVAGCAASDCCTPYCDLSAPDPDAACAGAGEMCVAWFDAGDNPPGLDHVGTCRLP